MELSGSEGYVVLKLAANTEIRENSLRKRTQVSHVGSRVIRRKGHPQGGGRQKLTWTRSFQPRIHGSIIANPIKNFNVQPLPELCLCSTQSNYLYLNLNSCMSLSPRPHICRVEAGINWSGILGSSGFGSGSAAMAHTAQSLAKKWSL